MAGAPLDGIVGQQRIALAQIGLDCRDIGEAKTASSMNGTKSIATTAATASGAAAAAASALRAPSEWPISTAGAPSASISATTSAAKSPAA